MNEIQMMAAQAALEKMIRDGYLSICTIDKILKMSGGVPDREDYEVLSALHCVNFKDMRPELRRGIPVLLQRVLGSDGIEVDIGRGRLADLALLASE